MTGFPDRAAQARRKRFLQAWGSLLLGLGLGLTSAHGNVPHVLSLAAIAVGLTALVRAYRMEIR